MAINIKLTFDELNSHYEKLKERLLSENNDKILNDYKQLLFEINNKEKKLNECFCKECLDNYLNLSFKLLTQDNLSHFSYTSLLNLRYFTSTRVVLFLKRHNINDDRFIHLMKKFESELEIVRMTNKQNIKDQFEKENLLDFLERKPDKSKSIQIIGWSLLGLLSSIGLVVFLYFYRKKYFKK